MKNCKVCEGAISPNAKICRHCGSRQDFSRVIKKVFILLLFSAITYTSYKAVISYNPKDDKEITKKNNNEINLSKKEIDSFNDLDERLFIVQDEKTYIEPTPLKIPEKPKLVKPVKPVKKKFIESLIENPEFCSEFKDIIGETIMLKLVNGNSYKCTIYSVEGYKVVYKIFGKNVKLTSYINDISSVQRSVIFKDYYKYLKAKEIYNEKLTEFENEKKKYDDEMSSWKSECEKIKGLNKHLIDVVENKL